MHPSTTPVLLLLLAASSLPAHHQSPDVTASSSDVASTCPSRADVFPCDCSDGSGSVVVRCHARADQSSSTFERLGRVLRALVGKKDVRISFFGYNVSQVPADAFRGVDVRKVVVSGGEVDGFESPAFGGLENSLEELVIQRAISPRGILSFKLDLGHLHQLRVLEVTDNSHGIYFDQKKMTLGNDWFEDGPTSLQVVRFSRNLIEKIGDSTFSSLSNLRDLDLQRNEIEEVRRGMFPESASRLESINLSYNKLAELPEDLFSNMPSLKKVNLMNNELGTIDQGTWEPVWERLDVLKFGAVICDSSIDWVFDLKRPRQLYAICSSHSDSDKRNQRLDKLIDRRQKGAVSV